jgi:hypothetical protein
MRSKSHFRRLGWEDHSTRSAAGWKTHKIGTTSTAYSKLPRRKQYPRQQFPHLCTKVVYFMAYYSISRSSASSPLIRKELQGGLEARRPRRANFSQLHLAPYLREIQIFSQPPLTPSLCRRGERRTEIWLFCELRRQQVKIVFLSSSWLTVAAPDTFVVSLTSLK